MENLDDLIRRDPVPELPPPNERARLRRKFGITQKHLAESLKISRQTVITWEAGTKEPTGENREAYAAVLNAWKETESHNSTGKGNRDAE